MVNRQRRSGRVQAFTVWAGVALVAMAVCVGLLGRLGRPPSSVRPSSVSRSAEAVPPGANSNAGSSGTTASSGRESEPANVSRAADAGAVPPLLIYCAAGIRGPVEQVVADYMRETGRTVQIQYGGSNTLLSQIAVSGVGDVFIAADETYVIQGRAQGLVQEVLPLASMRPVIAVRRDNPLQIQGLDDLLRPEVKTALANVEQAAIGQLTKSLLDKSGHWQRLREQVTANGVFKPTVPEVANDVKLGSVDAGIVWDTTVAAYPELMAVRTAELDAGRAQIAVGILQTAQQPAASLHLARYLTARDRGLQTFAAAGYTTIDGDQWADVPQLTFFCGSVNRRAVADVIKQFEQREGVVINTVYNGCGILTAQMKSMRGQDQATGFPDTYMACDRYYLDTVQDWFQDDVDISDAQVVIAVPKGNPANIRLLSDLARPGVRVSVGQPEQCTIGVLTRKVLESQGVYDEVMRNVVTQTASSAMLIPTVTTGSVDATLAYSTDTRAESDKVDAIPIDSAAATAVQPFAISRGSQYKHLGRRLYDTLAGSRAAFEAAGFHFRVEDSAERSEQQIAP